MIARPTLYKSMNGTGLLKRTVPICATSAGLPDQPGKVEFHHINATSKRDTLSCMATKPYILPFRYALKPVMFAIELMKVAPLSVENHKALHRPDHRGDRQTLNDRFDFDHDPFYQQAVKSFRTMRWIWLRIRSSPKPKMASLIG